MKILALRAWATLSLAFLSTASVSLSAADTNPPPRLTVELRDGSRVVGESVAEKIEFHSALLGKIRLPVKDIRTVEWVSTNSAKLTTSNGDTLMVSFVDSQLPVKTSFGKVELAAGVIRKFSVAIRRAGALPAGEGDIAFGGVNWQAWRTMFEIRDDKLVSLPKPRPGFNYGHSGNGRGPGLVSNIGNPDWRDYALEFECCFGYVDPAFNPYGLATDCRGGGIMFHVTDAKESWNECGSSGYCFSINGDGTWNLNCVYNEYCPSPAGYANMRNDARRMLASGQGLKLDSQNGNKYRIEVRGQRIQIWVDGAQVVDVTDDKMGQTIGGKTLDHGGVGIGWVHDTMGWIRNFSATQL
jgi:hypothetical protein